LSPERLCQKSQKCLTFRWCLRYRTCQHYPDRGS
jgi:hypothetical protein